MSVVAARRRAGGQTRVAGERATRRASERAGGRADATLPIDAGDRDQRRSSGADRRKAAAAAAMRRMSRARCFLSQSHALANRQSKRLITINTLQRSQTTQRRSGRAKSYHRARAFIKQNCRTIAAAACRARECSRQIEVEARLLVCVRLVWS